MALALYGELKAALVTCDAFVSQINAALAISHDDKWLDQKSFRRNFGPRVRTKVFEANVDKLGLLGEPLVGGSDPEEHLVVEIVSTFDFLFDYARTADREEVITNRDFLEEWDDLHSDLKDHFVIRLEETIEILRAYIYGGLPAATKAAHGFMLDREKRYHRLGKKLGIVPPTADETES